MEHMTVCPILVGERTRYRGHSDVWIRRPTADMSSHALTGRVWWRLHPLRYKRAM